MPSLAQLTTQPLTFKLVTDERLGAPLRSFYETNYQAGQQGRDAALGGEPLGDGSLFQARLESQMALRILRSVLPHQDPWQAGS